MRAGPTLMPGSADIGAPGTSVLAAHRDTHFAFLKDIRVGDVIEAAGADGVKLPYRVTSMKIVHADKFTIKTGLVRNELALSTCYPFGSVRGGKMRYVVRAVLECRGDHYELNQNVPCPAKAGIHGLKYLFGLTV